jgi:D-alanine--poly(phosphoribitol) ligase subunit 2
LAGALERFIRERFGVDEDDAEFHSEVHLFDYGYVDSFGAVELTNFVESTFKIEVKDSDFVVHPLNTITEIAAFVLKRRSGEI